MRVRTVPCKWALCCLSLQAPATAPTRCSPVWSDSPLLAPPEPASLPTATAAATHLSACPAQGLCLVGALPPVRYHFAICRHPSSPASPWWTRWNSLGKVAWPVCSMACLLPAAPAKASLPANITPSWAFLGQREVRAVPLTPSRATLY